MGIFYWAKKLDKPNILYNNLGNCKLKTEKKVQNEKHKN